MAQISAPYRALVIGIDHYESRDIYNLKGCVADARAVERFLRDRLALAEGQICLLLSGAEESPAPRATRAAIIDGIRHFLSKTPAGEEALLYYSGHGCQVSLHSEIAYHEKQGEALIPADAGVNGVPELLDREMRVLIAELVRKGIRLTCIIDSCHSGSVMRDDGRHKGPSEARTPSPNRPSQQRTLASLLGGSVTQEHLDALYQGEALPYTLLAAALPTQSSYEIRADEAGSRWRGAMTLALLEVLGSLPAPVTVSYTELARIVRAKLSSQVAAKQHPHVLGEQERLLWTNVERVRPRPLFAVQKVDEQTKCIVFDGGRIDGIEVGSEMETFADWSLGTPTGRWRVTQCAPAQSDAEPLAVTSWPPKPGQPLQLCHLPDSPRVRFYQGGDPRSQAVAIKWREKKSCFLVESRGEADYHVRLEGEVWVVREPDGTEIEALRTLHSREAPHQLARALDWVACYKCFMTEAPGNAALPEQEIAAITVTAKYAYVERRGVATPDLKAEAKPFRRKTYLDITISNGSSRSLYFTLYQVVPAKYGAERLSPDLPTETPPGEKKCFRWVQDEGGTTPLHLKLLISTFSLTRPQRLCGPLKIMRDEGDGGRAAGTIDAPDESEARWAVRLFTLEPDD